MYIYMCICICIYINIYEYKYICLVGPFPRLPRGLRLLLVRAIILTKLTTQPML